MKTIVVTQLGGPEVLELRDAPEPVPSAGEVLVRMDAAGVNFIDVYYRTGLYRKALPYTPGTEGAGTVVAVAADVTTVHVGDRVASQEFQGAYAELAVVKADKVVAVPAGVDTKVAAAAFLQGLTAHYLVTSVHRLQRGERCLVHAAAGGVGLLLCQMAREIGAQVIGTVSTQEKAQLAREAGAEDVILYTQEDFVAAVERITEGRRVHVVYDSVGATTFLRSMDCLVPRGMLALFGQSSGAVEPFDPRLLNQKGSLFLTRPTLGHYLATRQELEWRASELFQGIERKTLHIRIDRELPLGRARDAHHALESRETSGKILLTF